MLQRSDFPSLASPIPFVLVSVKSLVRFPYDLIHYRWGLKLLLQCGDDVVSLAMRLPFRLLHEMQLLVSRIRPRVLHSVRVAGCNQALSSLPSLSHSASLSFFACLFELHSFT